MVTNFYLVKENMILISLCMCVCDRVCVYVRVHMCACVFTDLPIAALPTIHRRVCIMEELPGM